MPAPIFTTDELSKAFGIGRERIRDEYIVPYLQRVEGKTPRQIVDQNMVYGNALCNDAFFSEPVIDGPLAWRIAIDHDIRYPRSRISAYLDDRTPPIERILKEAAIASKAAADHDGMWRELLDEAYRTFGLIEYEIREERRGHAAAVQSSFGLTLRVLSRAGQAGREGDSSALCYRAVFEFPHNDPDVRGKRMRAGDYRNVVRERLLQNLERERAGRLDRS